LKRCYFRRGIVIFYVENKQYRWTEWMTTREYFGKWVLGYLLKKYVMRKRDIQR